jgi:acetyl-CoA acetyltransferase
MNDFNDGRDIVFLSAARTGMGSFGGSLKGHSATDLGVIASEAAIERSGVEPSEFDHVDEIIYDLLEARWKR